MSDNCFQLSGLGFAGGDQIDFVVVPRIGNINRISVFRGKAVHSGKRSRFIVIGADMHTLDAQAPPAAVRHTRKNRQFYVGLYSSF